MKKFAILACLMTVTTGLAIAQQTVSIPFFADSSTAQRAFVGLQNTGATSIVVTVTYLDANGANGEAGGTFGLVAGQSISYQPSQTTGGEVQPGGLADATYAFGSVKMVTSGGTVAGRYVQLDSAGSFAHNLEIN